MVCVPGLGARKSWCAGCKCQELAVGFSQELSNLLAFRPTLRRGQGRRAWAILSFNLSDASLFAGPSFPITSSAVDAMIKAPGVASSNIHQTSVSTWVSIVEGGMSCIKLSA